MSGSGGQSGLTHGKLRGRTACDLDLGNSGMGMCRDSDDRKQHRLCKVVGHRLECRELDGEKPSKGWRVSRAARGDSVSRGCRLSDCCGRCRTGWQDVCVSPTTMGV